MKVLSVNSSLFLIGKAHTALSFICWLLPLFICLKMIFFFSVSYPTWITGPQRHSHTVTGRERLYGVDRGRQMDSEYRAYVHYEWDMGTLQGLHNGATKPWMSFIYRSSNVCTCVCGRSRVGSNWAMLSSKRVLHGLMGNALDPTIYTGAGGVAALYRGNFS